jgi:PqqD family protein of HPr-rel-A system
MRWQLANPSDTAVLRFDGDEEALVFNPATWETHLLNEAASLVLDALVEGPRSVDELVADVAKAGDVTLPDGFAEQVGELLGQLESLGLVRTNG